MAIHESFLIRPTVGISAYLPCKENKMMWAMYSFRFHLICHSTEAECTLTYKCSKRIWGQFLEDDWVGGPVSLENLEGNKVAMLLCLAVIYSWPQVTLSRTCPILNHVWICFLMYNPVSGTTEHPVHDYAHFVWQDFLQGFSTQPSSL